MNQMNTPKHIIENTIENTRQKIGLTRERKILLGILAGVFVAIGGEASSFAVHNITDVGTAKMIAGVIFPVGLIMILLIGGELFTGNCLISISVYQKKLKVSAMLKNWVVIYFSNMIGAVLVVLLVYLSGQFNASDGGLGAYTIKIASAKVGIPFWQALFSGILCNFLVCIAILMAGAAKDVVGKCIAVFFPIWAFVISGFEHCVANMYYIPAGILASQNSNYLEKASTLYGIGEKSMEQLTIVGMLQNLVPVTIGNIIGGSIMVGFVYFLIYGKENRGVV